MPLPSVHASPKPRDSFPAASRMMERGTLQRIPAPEDKPYGRPVGRPSGTKKEERDEAQRKAEAKQAAALLDLGKIIAREDEAKFATPPSDEKPPRPPLDVETRAAIENTIAKRKRDGLPPIPAELAAWLDDPQ